MKKVLLASAWIALGWTAITLAATPAVSVKAWDQKTVQREWRFQYSPVTADMNMWLTHRVRLPNGQYRDETFSAWIKVDLRFGMAPLRAGEVEQFDVEARDMGMSGDDPVVYVQVRPRDSYYYYFPQQQSLVVRNGGISYVYLNMYASGRLRMPAPATVDHLSAAFTTPTSPVTFKWQDYGAQDNPGSVAEYRFRVGRITGPFSNDAVVAQGELGAASTVTLTSGGQYTQGATEWFQDGKKYRLVVWMRRKNSDAYTEDYGQAEWGSFTFSHGSGMLQAPVPVRIPLPQEKRFEALYPGR
ncbi:MAG: hypothetical protein HY303_16115 [Candidatus Wallbacteria bacterium]|nr:hypothetical protein [Candidatus Wallbacteria bacterium]